MRSQYKKQITNVEYVEALAGTFLQPGGNFQAKIQVNKLGMVYLSTHSTEKEAHERYKEAYLEWHGKPYIFKKRRARKLDNKY